MAGASSPDMAVVRTGSTIPVPDPTQLTTEAVARLETVLKELFNVRIGALERDIAKVEDGLGAVPAATVVAIAHLQKLMDEKFKGVADQFAGRDTALAAALLAQKTSVDEQNKSNALSASKAEAGFTKEIDGAKATITAAQSGFDDKIESLKVLIAAGNKSSEDKIEDVRSRVGAIENQKKGATDNLGAILGGAGLFVAIVAAIAAFGVWGKSSSAVPIIIERSATGDKIVQ